MPLRRQNTVGRLFWVGALVFSLALLSISEARAQDFPEPTNRNHTIDMYLGSAIGSARIIGMGGAATATAEGSSGMLANPASAGVRPTTSNSVWDWDWHLDSLTPGFGSDHDNNGIKTEDVSFAPSITFGVALQYKDWGIGVTGIGLRTENDQGVLGRVSADTAVTKLHLSHYMVDGQLVVGAGIRGALLTVETQSTMGVTQRLLELQGGAVEGGALWKPNEKNVRIAGSLSLPVISDETTIGSCFDPLNCAGYVLPGKVKVPWEARVGIAARRGPTPWNRKVKTRWRDEKALLWTVDLVLTGKTKNGVGLEAFGQHQLQPSGRKIVYSLRGGAEYEWFPGRFRVRAGSYWEPSRFRDPAGEDISGRLHLTAGFNWRIWDFKFWDSPYRVAVSFTADGAKNFGNTGLSIGFWH